VGPRNHVLDGRAHWHHLANTVERCAQHEWVYPQGWYAAFFQLLLAILLSSVGVVGWLQESGVDDDQVSLNQQGTATADDEVEMMVRMYPYPGTTTNIHPYLSTMVNYLLPVKFQGFDISAGRCSLCSEIKSN